MALSEIVLKASEKELASSNPKTLCLWQSYDAYLNVLDILKSLCALMDLIHFISSDLHFLKMLTMTIFVVVLFFAYRLQSLKGYGHPSLSQPRQKQPLLRMTTLAALDEQFKAAEPQLRTAIDLIENYQHCLVDMKVKLHM